jgi:hypothetical protein
LTLGLVVEGEADYGAIPLLLKTAGATVGRGMVFRGQSVGCSVEMLVRRKLLSHTRAQILKGYSKVLVIVDREDRNDCPGEFAQRVQNELVGQLQANYNYPGTPPVSVVCADRCLENWLIADPEGIGEHSYIQKDISRRVGNNADSKDAVGILHWAYGPRRFYDKSRDASQIAARVRTDRGEVRKRSKSLDKLLREACV